MSSDRPKGLKLRIGSSSALSSSAAAPEPTQTPPLPTPGGSVRFKLKKSTTDAPPPSKPPPKWTAILPTYLKPTATTTTPPTKPKRKYTKRDPTASGSASKNKKRAVEIKHESPTKSAKPPVLQSRPSVPKIKIKANQQPSTPAITPRVRVKHSGQKPVRPLGVGYDSEASDVEDDPAIESQFILSMQSGPDSEYLRKMIAEKKVGIKLGEGGADVYIKFFDREGRRSMVVVRGNIYAASMVDLPTVTESLKSWDKKNWFKSADICQKLAVLGRVQSEEEAKTFPLPKEIDPQWQYAHGLTPPMRWVRNRRFKPRVNYREIEEVEKEVDRQLKLDEECVANGGYVEYEWIKLNGSDKGDDDEDEDGEGDEEAMEEDYLNTQDAQVAAEYGDQDGGEGMEGVNYEFEDEEDDGNLAAMLEEGLEAPDEQDQDTDALLVNTDVAVTPSSADAAGLSGGVVSADDTGDAAETGDDDDESDNDAIIDEIDEDAKAQQAEAAQQREEIADLEREVETARAQMEAQGNPLLKQRLRTKLEGLQNELNMKKELIGDESDA
ncbi:MAG: hypothetical protein M1820_000780 [Bogoriella megaspora]|nr:MAG: hypothetical protein M1820_000780 [Bogoriella megaspora]